MEVNLTGGGLDRVGRRLRDAAGPGSGGLVDAVRDGLEDGARTLPTRIAENVARALPRRGGLASLAAMSRVDVRRVASGLEVTIDGDRVNVAGIDAGRVVHPVFGNRLVSVLQRVEPGAFTDPIEEAEPQLRRGVQEAVRDLARSIER